MKMESLTRTDFRGVLDLLYDLGSMPSTDPFPLPVLARLGTLLGANKTGYGEFSLTDGGQSYVVRRRLILRTEPEWLLKTVQRLWLQDPIVCRAHGRAVEPMAVSDRMSMRTFHRLEYFRQVHHPFGTLDCVRLFLPAPNGMSRFFWFDQERWGLKQRERELLELLRPHLVLWRSRWSAPVPGVLQLTAREQDVLRAVADGATNRQIAAQLWISAHTVRTHLEHIFEKLDVHTRTEAAALLRDANSVEPEPWVGVPFDTLTESAMPAGRTERRRARLAARPDERPSVVDER